MKSGDRVETRNVTLSLPVTLLKKVKRLAVERETSISRLLTEALERELGEADGYERAMKSLLSRPGKALGTHGKRTWTRDEIHDRRS